jgi:hypothetical protein
MSVKCLSHKLEQFKGNIKCINEGKNATFHSAVTTVYISIIPQVSLNIQIHPKCQQADTQQYLGLFYFGDNM